MRADYLPVLEVLFHRLLTNHKEETDTSQGSASKSPETRNPGPAPPHAS